MTATDMQLIERYTQYREEGAFAELVRRHIGLVFSSALRQVRSRPLAEDIAQSVFLALARQSSDLAPNTIVAAWLYEVSRRAAIDCLRRETRRQNRERIAFQISGANAVSTDWTCIEPFLDEAMQTLSKVDRAAVLLRYFENKSLREVGSALDMSENAAQKRIRRAIVLLHDFYAKRGIKIGASGLALIISGNATNAVPIGLSVSVSEAAYYGSIAGAVGPAVKTIAMTTLQKILVTATITLAVGTGFYEWRQAARERSVVLELQRREALLKQDIQLSNRELGGARKQVALFNDEIARIKSIRADREQTGAEDGRVPADASLKSRESQISFLKEKLEQMSDKKIPELVFATEKDWVNAVSGNDLTSDDGVRQAFSKLRENVENTFLNEMMKGAVNKYLASHDNVLPPDLFKLKGYFEVPVTDAMLQRYELLQTGNPDKATDLVRLIAFADKEYDSNHGMSLNGAWGSGFNKVQQAVQLAAFTFARDNNGQLPSDPSQLSSYLTGPIDPASLQKYLSQVVASPPPEEVIALLQR